MAFQDFELPLWWRDGDSLRMYYNSKLNLENTLELIKTGISWTYYNYGRELSPQAKQLLVNGYISIIGRTDRFKKPILQIDFEDQEALDKMEDVSNSQIYLIFLIRENMHIPGVIEHIVIIMDLKDKNSFNIGRIFKQICDILDNTFFGISDYIFMLNMSASMKYFIKSMQSSFSIYLREHMIAILDTDYDLVNFEDESLFIDDGKQNLDNVDRWPPKLNSGIGLNEVITNKDILMANKNRFLFNENNFKNFQSGNYDETVFETTYVCDDPTNQKTSNKLTDFENDAVQQSDDPQDSKYGFFGKVIGMGCCGPR